MCTCIHNFILSIIQPEVVFYNQNESSISSNLSTLFSERYWLWAEFEDKNIWPCCLMIEAENKMQPKQTWRMTHHFGPARHYSSAIGCLNGTGTAWFFMIVPLFVCLLFIFRRSLRSCHHHYRYSVQRLVHRI